MNSAVRLFCVQHEDVRALAEPWWSFGDRKRSFVVSVVISDSLYDSGFRTFNRHRNAIVPADCVSFRSSERPPNTERFGHGFLLRCHWVQCLRLGIRLLVVVAKRNPTLLSESAVCCNDDHRGAARDLENGLALPAGDRRIT